MQYRLGVDIGTSSVAVMAFELSNDKPMRRIYQDLVIFGEPVLPKELKLKNESRRKARGMRRQIQRKKARIQKILYLAHLLGIGPKELAAASKALGHPENIWRLRVETLDEKNKLTLAQLILIFLRLAKNRGYFGVKPSVKKKSGELGKVSAGIEISETLFEKYPNARTFAEAVWLKSEDEVMKKNDGGQPQRHLRKLSETGTYVLRHHIENEFKKIIAAQAKNNHPFLNATITEGLGQDFSNRINKPQTRYFWGRVPATVAEAFEYAIFYQHPLGSFKDKIGKCSLESGEIRTIAADPVFQAFRITKLLSDLRWINGKEEENLTEEQNKILRNLLNEKEELKFSSIYKAFDKAGVMNKNGLTLNFHTLRRDYLKGNTTYAGFRKLGLLDKFLALPKEIQTQVITALANDVLGPEQWGIDKQRSNVVSLYGEEAATFIDLIAKENDGLERLAKMGFDAKRVKYSTKALRALEEAMFTHGLNETDACAFIYPNTSNQIPTIGELPSVETLDLRSPVVKHALEETHKVLSRCFRKLGNPAHIVIELSREMKKTLEERNDIEGEQRRRESNNARVKTKLREDGYPVTPLNIKRYLLWEEQAERCPYSGKKLSLGEILDGSKTQIEHIIPHRLHGVGNRMKDIVLATTQFNGLKGADETPYMAARHNRNVGKWNWDRTKSVIEEICKESKAFKVKAKHILDETLLRAENFSDDDFIDRQLQETSWIGRIVNIWCRHVCKDVTVIRGALTAKLREMWELNSILEEVREKEGKHNSEKAKQLFYKEALNSDKLIFNKRCDHRQHLIDAAIIALSTPGMYQAAVRARKIRQNMRTFDCPVIGLRQSLLKLLIGYEVWHKPDRLINGELFNAKPFGGDHLILMRKREAGKLTSRKFNAKLDRKLIHKDRHGKDHYKLLASAETACIHLTEEGIQSIGFAEFRKKYINDKNLNLPKKEKFFFKDDIIYLPQRKKIYRIAQLKTRDGLACIPTTESRTFGDLTNSRLNITLKDIEELREAKVLRHQGQLAKVLAELSADKNET